MYTLCSHLMELAHTHCFDIFIAWVSVGKTLANVGAEIARALGQGGAGDVVSSRAFQSHSVSVGWHTRSQQTVSGLVALISAQMSPRSPANTAAGRCTPSVWRCLAYRLANHQLHAYAARALPRWGDSLEQC